MLDGTNNEVVTYIYDTWGKLLSIGGSLAGTVGVQNAFRYRGYYYDTETGMYYLQSRYYNPDMGRFISMGDPSYNMETNSCYISSNLYVYYSGNPIKYTDPSGHELVNACQDYILHNAIDSYISQIEKGPNGYKLISSLRNSQYTTTIRYVNYYWNGSQESGENRNNQTVWLNICDQYLYFWIYDPGTDRCWKKNNMMPPNIILAHELVHAYRGINGNLVKGFYVNHYYNNDKGA